MKSLWNESEAANYSGDLQRRVYTSRLLGLEPALVLHGGGNTSVKTSSTDPFGKDEDILFIKGSGGNLATIDASGFAPVRLEPLLQMAELQALSDSEMVRLQRCAMIDPNAPNPSVEAILHAIIPFKFVDHTHADAVVAITNTAEGRKRIEAIYGDRVLVVPYVMPGFVLARKVYELTRGLDWKNLEGIILLNHGIFTFADDGRESYDLMIKLVTQAESYLAGEDALPVALSNCAAAFDSKRLATLRKEVSLVRGAAVLARLDDGQTARGFASLPAAANLSTRGCLTPDHVIRTKRIPLVVEDETGGDPVGSFATEYAAYFKRNRSPGMQMLDPSPRWALWRNIGTVSFGATATDVTIVADVVRHTLRAIQWAENLGGWRALPERDLFEMEYWELEQAKLKKGGVALPLQGRVALVTGAAGGIGKACFESLRAQGACVVGLDVKAEIEQIGRDDGALGLICDVTDAQAVSEAIQTTIRQFGGLDILISNAGLFPPSHTIAEMNLDDWRRSLELNLSSHQMLMQLCIPLLELGWQPAIVIIASKNVPAPGPGAGAYSVAKAGLTQLGRVAALELAGKGIRVNIVHPNAVFDTGLWTEEILETRAKHYGLSVEKYKTNNLLGVEVTSRDVAEVATALAGPLFSRTTGAQIAVDGGNDRVI